MTLCPANHFPIGIRADVEDGGEHDSSMTDDDRASLVVALKHFAQASSHFRQRLMVVFTPWK